MPVAAEQGDPIARADPEPGQSAAQAVDLVAQLAVGDLLVAAHEGDRVGGMPVDHVGDVHQIDVVRPPVITRPHVAGGHYLDAQERDDSGDEDRQQQQTDGEGRGRAHRRAGYRSRRNVTGDDTPGGRPPSSSNSASTTASPVARCSSEAAER